MPSRITRRWTRQPGALAFSRRTFTVPKLASVATMLGIATGVLTLKAELFGSSEAQPPAASERQPTNGLGAYSRAVGDVCDDLNLALERNQAARLKLRRELKSAASTVRQRDLLMNNVEEIATSSSHVLVRFEGIAPPDDVAKLQHSTVTIWKDTLETLREYRRDLGDQRSWQGLNELMRRFNDSDALNLDRNEIAIHARLGRLSDGECELERKKTIGVFYVPNRDEPATNGTLAEDRGAAPDDSGGPGPHADPVQPERSVEAEVVPGSAPSDPEPVPDAEDVPDPEPVPGLRPIDPVTEPDGIPPADGPAEIPPAEPQPGG